MRKSVKYVAALLAATMTIGGLAGCVNSASSDTGSNTAASDSNAGVEESASSDNDYDFYIFNAKGENADALAAAVDAYEAETGLTIKVFSLGSGTPTEEALRVDMSSDHKPAIFGIMDPQALKEWVEGDFALDLTTADLLPEFKALADDLDPGLRLTMDGQDSYGIPYNVEGYGYIVDKEMIAALVGEDNVDSFIEKYKTATYDEFADFVEKVNAYIKDGKGNDFALSGQTFSLLAEKNEKAEKLEGVFSVAGSEKWTYGDHLINIPIDSVFPNVAAAVNATDEQLDKLYNPMVAYAKTLDLITSHAVSERGPEFINSTTNGYDAAVANFANGKTLFIKQGNWCYTNIKNANSEIVDTLTILPIKMPFEQGDIAVDGLTVEHMNSSIPVFCGNYYVLNKQVSQHELEEAQKFLVWLNTSEEGQHYVTEEMAFIPYNADPATTVLGNSLSDCIIGYMSEGNTLTNAYAGAPARWATEVFGLKIMEEYLTKPEWTEQDYEDIANYTIASWKEAKQ